MDTVTLVLSNATVSLPITLFEDYKSCVVNLMLDSYVDLRLHPADSNCDLTVELKDISLVEWNTIKLLLKGKILESHLSEELLAKASLFGFTRDATHYLREDKKLSNKALSLELFLSGYGSDIFFVCKNKYHVLKEMLPSNITPVAILVEDNNIIKAISLHGRMFVKIEVTNLGEIRQYYEKYELCFGQEESESIVEDEYTIYGYCPSDLNLDVNIDGLPPKTDSISVSFPKSFENSLRNMASNVFKKGSFLTRSISLLPYDRTLKDIKIISQTIAKNETLIGNEVERLHSKSNIVGHDICTSAEDTDISISTHTLLYCYVRV